jgi:hypothetical protein
VLFWLPGAVRERRLHEELTDAGVRYPVATAIHGAGNPAEAVWWLHRWQGRRLRLASWTVKTRTRRLSPGDVGGYTRFSGRIYRRLPPRQTALTTLSRRNPSTELDQSGRANSRLVGINTAPSTN